MNLDPEALRYHTDQWHSTKRSTVAFERFCRGRLQGSGRIIDMGAGACTAFLADRYRDTQFTAFDQSIELLTLGAGFAQRQGLNNLGFMQGDWLAVPPLPGFDGVVSLQTLSWLPDHEAALLAIFQRLKPRWLGLTSLFYEGEISCRIEVQEHKRARSSHYNVYALPAISRLCEAHGYRLTRYEPFEIDVDLPKPRDPDMVGTYTRRLAGEDGKRLQISGPVLMNWYMVLIERAEAA